MPISLFKHNAQAYEAALEMPIDTGKAAIIHPTGTGKSFIGFKLCEDNPEKLVCWFSPPRNIFLKRSLRILPRFRMDMFRKILFFTLMPSS